MHGLFVGFWEMGKLDLQSCYQDLCWVLWEMVCLIGSAEGTVGGNICWVLVQGSTIKEERRMDNGETGDGE